MAGPVYVSNLFTPSPGSTTMVQPIGVAGSSGFQDVRARNVFAGTGAASTSSTTGFVATQSGAGPPVGVPSPLLTGSALLYVDTTDVRMYGYFSGAWNSLTAAGGTGTWAQVLATGNTTGANNPLITSGQGIGFRGVTPGVDQITWGTGGAFGVNASQILGPSDTNYWITAGQAGGVSNGRGIILTATSGSTAGSGGIIGLTAGNGSGSNQAGGGQTYDAGNSTGNSAFTAFLWKAPPIGASGLTVNTSANLFSVNNFGTMQWATGLSLFSIGVPQIASPTDQGLFISGSAGAGVGNPITIAGGGGAAAAGGLATVIGGIGNGTDKSSGGIVIDMGASTGAAAAQTILFKGPPLTAGSGAGSNASVAIAKFAGVNNAQNKAYSFVANATGTALSTTGVDGFVYIGSSAGAPAGTPTTYTGSAPITVDSTNNNLYFYSGGSWRIANTAGTWATVLASGNTSGATSPIISAGQGLGFRGATPNADQITYGTGGTYAAATPEILGPTDQGFFITAGTPGAGTGNGVTFTASVAGAVAAAGGAFSGVGGAGGATSGAGGASSIVGGAGVGSTSGAGGLGSVIGGAGSTNSNNNSPGNVTLDTGAASGNATGVISFKAPPLNGSSGAAAAPSAVVAKFAGANSGNNAGAYSFVANATGSSLGTSATDGFVFIGSSAGTPTGTPTTYTGANPITIDSTNNIFYYYSGGAWRQAVATWSNVLAAGNTSGANNPIINSGQGLGFRGVTPGTDQILWGTGGTFTATNAQIKGATDTSFFLSAGQITGTANGNSITATAGGGSTTGAGGSISLVGGAGAGLNQAAGTLTFDTGNSTGNKQYYAVVMKGAPVGGSGSGANSSVNIWNIDGGGTIYVGAQPTNLSSGIGSSMNFQFNAAATGTANGPGGISWSTGWGSVVHHLQGPTDQDLLLATASSTHSMFLEAGASASNGVKVATSAGSSSGALIFSNKLTSYGGGTGLTLTGTGSGIIFSQDVITQYNGINTAAQGVSPIYASGRFTGQNAQKATVCTYTPTADGTFSCVANVNVTASANFSFNVIVAYTDETSTPQTLILSFLQPTVLIGPTVSVYGLLASTNPTPGGPYCGYPSVIRVKANTAITVGTSTGTYTSVTYNIDAQIMQLL